MMIKVFVKNPGEKGVIKEVKNDLESFQSLVGGLIESCFVSERLQNNGIGCYCNDEGKLIGQRPNIWTEGKYDVLVGPLVFFADDGEGGEVSLKSEQIALIEEELSKNQISAYEMLSLLRII